MKMFVQAEAKLAVQTGDVSAGACERGCGCIYSAGGGRGGSRGERVQG